MQSIDFFWAFKKLKFNLNTKLQKNEINFDWLKLREFKLIPKNVDAILALQKDVDSSYISNINSKYNKDIIDMDARMKALEKEEALKDAR
jgi:hypothetical protein